MALGPHRRVDVMSQSTMLPPTCVILTSSRPERADLVGTVAEATGVWALHQLRDRMRADPEGRRILEERPRVTVGAECGLRCG